jgi:hypothetical protein
VLVVLLLLLLVLQGRVRTAKAACVVQAGAPKEAPISACSKLRLMPPCSVRRYCPSDRRLKAAAAPPTHFLNERPRERAHVGPTARLPGAVRG